MQDSGQMGGQGQQTGARDDTYDIVAVLYHALKGADNCDKYIRDAQDGQLRSFFQEAQQQQRQLAERAKQCLMQKIGQGGGSGSAFSFGQGNEGGQSDTNGMNAQGRGYGDTHGGSSTGSTGMGQQQHQMAGGQSGGTSGSSSS